MNREKRGKGVRGKKRRGRVEKEMEGKERKELGIQ